MLIKILSDCEVTICFGAKFNSSDYHKLLKVVSILGLTIRFCHKCFVE